MHSLLFLTLVYVKMWEEIGATGSLVSLFALFNIISLDGSVGVIVLVESVICSLYSSLISVGKVVGRGRERLYPLYRIEKLS